MSKKIKVIYITFQFNYILADFMPVKNLEDSYTGNRRVIVALSMSLYHFMTTVSVLYTF